MNIQDIKSAIADKAGMTLPNLMLTEQKDEQGVVQPWLSHWDNDKRVRIVMHTDVAVTIQSNPTVNTLAFKYEVVPAHENVLEYSRYVVIIPTSVKMVL